MKIPRCDRRRSNRDRPCRAACEIEESYFPAVKGPAEELALNRWRGGFGCIGANPGLHAIRYWRRVVHANVNEAQETNRYPDGTYPSGDKGSQPQGPVQQFHSPPNGTTGA